MALRHRTHPTFGVQFHPESVLTEHGYDLLGAFLARTARMTRDPVWVDGSLGGTIDPADRGLTLGDGVFDTLVAFNRMPFAGERHLARLASHAAAIGIALDLAAVSRRVGLRSSARRGANTSSCARRLRAASPRAASGRKLRSERPRSSSLPRHGVPGS